MKTAKILIVLLAAVMALGVACAKKGGAAAQYHCPMHPTYIADKPGDCPICGMKLVPIETKTKPAPSGAAAYACPMHPEVTSDQPGKCSKCGMDLEPVKPDAAKTMYQCPMKCEPPTDTPGKCGKCGMDLEPMEAPAVATGERKVLFYRNPMDPSVTSPTPMKDPMGMDYLPVTSDEAPSAASAGMEGYAPVELGAEGIALSGVQTAAAAREALSRPIRAVGTVQADETRVRHVHTKIAGWVEKLFVDFTGRFVRKGEPILSLYSPELLASQQEFLNARAARDKFASSSLPEVREGGDQLLAAARQRLELFDVPPEFIARLEQSGAVQRTVTLLAPAGGYVTAKGVFEGQQVEPGMELFVLTDLSTVWVEADLYEYEAPFVKVGQKAVLTLPFDPAFRREARVAYLYPSLNPETRTLRVRVEAANPGLKLKPAMFANAELEVEPVEGTVIPDSALMDSGTRKLVFVETAPGTFIPREVAVGVRGEGKVQVTSGVTEGERVVVKANFLLDSESRLRAAIEAQAEEQAGRQAGGQATEKPIPGHQH